MQICLATQLLHGHGNEKGQRPSVAVRPFSTGRKKNDNGLHIWKEWSTVYLFLKCPLHSESNVTTGSITGNDVNSKDPHLL